MKPSSSTVGSGIAIPVSLISGYYFKLPTEVAMAVGSLVGFLLGYAGDIIDLLILRRAHEKANRDLDPGT